jgi:hypothetical protein
VCSRGSGWNRGTSYSPTPLLSLYSPLLVTLGGASGAVARHIGGPVWREVGLGGDEPGAAGEQAPHQEEPGEDPPRGLPARPLAVGEVVDADDVPEELVDKSRASSSFVCTTARVKASMLGGLAAGFTPVHSSSKLTPRATQRRHITAALGLGFAPLSR